MVRYFNDLEITFKQRIKSYTVRVVPLQGFHVVTNISSYTLSGLIHVHTANKETTPGIK